MNCKVLLKNMQKTVSKRSPEILTGIGIGGMLTTVIFAVKATPKAAQIIKEAEEAELIEKKIDVVKVAWKPYMPAFMSFVLSSFCIIEANSVNHKRNVALATAYQVSKTALTEYRDKVVETIGEKKELAIRQSVDKDRMDKKPVSENTVIVTNKGDTLCFDAFSGQYFKSNIDDIKKAQNELNEKMIKNTYASLNDLYDILGLKQTRMGDRLGWNIYSDEGTINIWFSSQLADDGTPCIVINYDVEPTYDYDRFM